MNRINIHCFSKLNFATNLYELPLMLKTILLSLRMLAWAYVCLTSDGDFQSEFIAVSYQVFKCCSESGYFSQKSLNVLFANILCIKMSNHDAKIINNSHFGNFSEGFFALFPTFSHMACGGLRSAYLSRYNELPLKSFH
jgi:hypothetical protein